MSRTLTIFLILFLAISVFGECALPVKVLFKTKSSGVETESQKIITTEEQYEKMIDGIFHSYPEEMNVDFTKHRVFIAFLGQRPNGCYGIDIGKVEVDDNVLTIEIIEKVPAQNCMCTQMIVTPAVGILIPRIDVADMSIKKSRSVLQCD